MESMKNIKKPAYAVELGKGLFVALTPQDWYCKYCMRHPGSGSWSGGNFMPSSNPDKCDRSPTGYHVWEHL